MSRVSPSYESPCPIRWVKGQLYDSLLLDAWTVVFPSLERFMIESVRQCVPEALTAPAVRRFIAQETQHAHEHTRSRQLLVSHGFRLEQPLQVLSALMRALRLGARFLEKLGGKTVILAVFASAEHWTACIAQRKIDTFPSDGPMLPIVRLYLWHGVEEIEHRAVVFQLFQDHGGTWLHRVVGHLAGSIGFGLLTGTMLTMLSLQGPRVLQRSRSLVLWELARSAVRSFPASVLVYAEMFLLYLRPGYHPDQLPGAEHSQQRAQALLAP